ncbi:sensor domain-containing diguanylate cyclase [Pseudidiomarina gelatinasegens]|uniref:diguanylate cyclase n=1 Tax=Pseudidiomarina gelatinasegens TaxID=2487740 RepID=A0A451GEP2_9GAMM|nr:sensor domain-containing diguanylate cyclase [Pseudidiomarina gelatinasegens]RWU11561.1 sensor domain-containing diguanylate cyclase [Pseudidiomarina gelatinasegens]
MPIKDLTERYSNLTAAQLRERLYCLETVVSKSKIGVWQLCVATGKLSVNQYFAELLGLTWHPELALTFDDVLKIIHPDDRQSAKNQFKQYLAGKNRDFEVEFRVQFADGSWHWVRDIGAVVTLQADGQAEKIVGSWFDVNDMVESSQRLRKITRTIPGVIYEFELYPDGSMRFPYSSEGISDIAGVSPEQIRDDASVLFSLIHPDDISKVQHSILESAQSLTEWFCEYRLIKGDSERWLTGYAVPERDDASGVVRWYGQIVDTTADKELELELLESKITLEKAQELGNIGYWRADLTTGELAWSDEIFRIFGLDKEHVKPTIEVFDRAIYPDDFKAVKASMERARESGIHDVEHRIVRADGEIRWVHELAGFRGDDSRDVMIGTIRDVTEQKLYQRELERLNVTDELTKVNNRRFFIASLERELKSIVAASRICVAIVDIDYFKIINDQYGHAEGDLVLKTVSAFINEQLRPGDVFARIGGEEFALLLHRVEGADAKRRLNAIRQLISELAFCHNGESYQVTATIGMTMLNPQDTRDDVLHRADEALYRGKRDGRNCVVWSEVD